MERVLFVVKAREFGGLEIVLLDWLSQIDRAKASIAVCCYGTEALNARLAALGSGVENIPLTVRDDAPFWKALRGWYRLLSSIHSTKTVFLDGLVGDFAIAPVLAAWLSTWSSDPKHFYIFESNWGRSVPSKGAARKLHYGFLPGIGLHRRKEKFEQRLRVKLAHRVFTMSQGIKDNLVAHYGCPTDRISVLHHGVDTARYRPSSTEGLDFRRTNAIPDDALVMVSHGRPVPRKRIDRILSAFEILYPQHQNLWLLLTAYGPLADEIEKSVAVSPARTRIKLLGFQQDPTRILKASDIYVLSSNDEGFGIALVEALSTGLVCVATNGPGPTDILQNGENGFLVEPTVEGVLAGLRQVLRLTAQERAQLVDRARKTVELRFEISGAIRAALDALEIPRK